MGAIPFNQNVWFKILATSMQYRMEQYFRNIYPNFRKLSSGSFLSAFNFAPECKNEIACRYHIGEDSIVLMASNQSAFSFATLIKLYYKA